jgi:hypothetical protein
MERMDGTSAYRMIVLQDAKRLPGRFYAHLTGAVSCRLR